MVDPNSIAGQVIAGLFPKGDADSWTRDQCITAACKVSNRVWDHLDPEGDKSLDCICPGELFQHAEAGHEVWNWINEAIDEKIKREA